MVFFSQPEHSVNGTAVISGHKQGIHGCIFQFISDIKMHSPVNHTGIELFVQIFRKKLIQLLQILFCPSFHHGGNVQIAFPNLSFQTLFNFQLQNLVELLLNHSGPIAFFHINIFKCLSGLHHLLFIHQTHEIIHISLTANTRMSHINIELRLLREKIIIISIIEGKHFHIITGNLKRMSFKHHFPPGLIGLFRHKRRRFKAPGRCHHIGIAILIMMSEKLFIQLV